MVPSDKFHLFIIIKCLKQLSDKETKMADLKVEWTIEQLNSKLAVLRKEEEEGRCIVESFLFRNGAKTSCDWGP